MFSQLVFSKRELSFEQHRDTEHDIIPHPFIFCLSGVFNVNPLFLLIDPASVRVQGQPWWRVSSNHHWVCLLHAWTLCVGCFWNKYQDDLVLPPVFFYISALFVSFFYSECITSIDVLMLQGYREKKASRALAGSKGLLGLMAVREKRGKLDRRVPEVPFLLLFYSDPPVQSETADLIIPPSLLAEVELCFRHPILAAPLGLHLEPDLIKRSSAARP